jgi:glycosyltransferase involved in cell wall biosynthesis
MPTAARDGSGPVRVLFVTTSMMRGGAETQVFLIARELHAQGAEVSIVSMRDPEAYGAELADLGIDLVSLGMERGRADVRAIARLAAIVRRRRPDVVHAHMLHASLLARVARPLAWAPVLISTAHSLSEAAAWRHAAYRLTDPLCTLTTAVCEACAERHVEVGAVPKRKIRVVPNGIEVQAYGVDRNERQRIRQELGVGDEFLWLAVGRLEPEKDYPTMLRAVAEARSSGPACTLLVAGEGADRDAIVAARDRLGLGDEAVRFLGARTDVPRLMAAADGYLMSSVTEALPLVLLEASAAGLPIVTTRVGGTPEMVTEGRNGDLAAVGDASGLASRMIRLAEIDLPTRVAMGAEGRRLVEERFEIGKVAQRWHALYRELLHRDTAD